MISAALLLAADQQQSQLNGWTFLHSSGFAGTLAVVAALITGSIAWRKIEADRTSAKDDRDASRDQAALERAMQQTFWLGDDTNGVPPRVVAAGFAAICTEAERLEDGRASLCGPLS